MKNTHTIISLVVALMVSLSVKAQDIYSTKGGEFIFGLNNASFTEEFLAQYPGASMEGSNLRFSMFFHYTQFLHVDFTNNIGMLTGVGIRNVGMITDEVLPQTVSLSGQEVAYTNYNIVRRQYLLGIPIGLKVGSFRDHVFFYGGLEYELAFHYKEKVWTGSFDRSGKKSKSSEWFGDQTEILLPSAFGGVQFPGGINVRFKYYLTDFLNPDYTIDANNQDGGIYDISDLSRFAESQLFFISLSWQVNTKDMKSGKFFEGIQARL